MNNLAAYLTTNDLTASSNMTVETMASAAININAH